MTKRAGIDRFLQIVTAEGQSHPEFHFYAARREQAPALAPPLSGSPARTFHLSDEAWGYQVDVFELVPRLEPAEIPGALLRGLENLVAQGAPLAWLMFDGAFNGVGSLATAWGARNTYGIAGVGIPPHLALAKRERAAEQWREEVLRAVDGFSRALGEHPG